MKPGINRVLLEALTTGTDDDMNRAVRVLAAVRGPDDWAVLRRFKAQYTQPLRGWVFDTEAGEFAAFGMDTEPNPGEERLAMLAEDAGATYDRGTCDVDSFFAKQHYLQHIAEGLRYAVELQEEYNARQAARERIVLTADEPGE